MDKEQKMPTSFRLDATTKAALSVLCDETHRKTGDMVKHLIFEEIKRLGLSAKVAERAEGE